MVYLSPSQSFFVALVSLGPTVALLDIDLSPSQSFMLCVAQHLELLCSFLTCLRLNVSSFVLLNTSSRFARWRLVSISIIVALVCSTHRVALLVVDWSRLSQPFLFCVEHLDSLCSLFSCLWRLSKYSTFVGPFLLRVFRCIYFGPLLGRIWYYYKVCESLQIWSLHEISCMWYM